LFGLPAILVPYPFAWRYQRINANYLVKRGAAELIEDAQLADQIVPKVRELMADHAKREKMSQIMHSLAKPEAAANIARLLSNLAITTPTGSLNVPNPSG
jgi:UDP-N-acetylglucosamine--N-acetylmuramyl-(pentapeptide) pyrophosphoryl-undecaprenol N-acetylglucosamine transferase